jgi:hypothetical protein
MPRLTCLCGESLSLSEFPNGREYPLFSDNQLEEIQNLLSLALGTRLTELERQSRINDVFAKRRPNPEMVECLACGRVAFFAGSADRVPAIWYKPEVANHSRASRIGQVFCT